MGRNVLNVIDEIVDLVDDFAYPRDKTLFILKLKEHFDIDDMDINVENLDTFKYRYMIKYKNILFNLCVNNIGRKIALGKYFDVFNEDTEEIVDTIRY